METPNNMEPIQGNNPTNEDLLDNLGYSSEELTYLESIEAEGNNSYPVGQVFNTVDELRNSLRSFAHKKGFALTTAGNRLVCTRCDEPQHQINRRNKKPKVAADKQRKSTSTRAVWLPFRN